VTKPFAILSAFALFSISSGVCFLASSNLARSAATSSSAFLALASASSASFLAASALACAASASFLASSALAYACAIV
jgi:hypothetical protein